MEVVIPAAGDVPATPAWAAFPEGATRGVVVVHEITGRQPEIDLVVERFAAAGYAGVAPDLFAQGFVRCVARAIRDSGTGKGPQFDQLRRARAWLAERAGIAESRVGIVGFCLGGGFALAAGPGWGPVSANYGFVPTDEALAAGGPVIACYGGKDRMMRNEPPKLRERLDAVGREGEVHVFPSVGHSFLTEGSHWWSGMARRFDIGHDAVVAEEAWARILAFFDERLP